MNGGKGKAGKKEIIQKKKKGGSSTKENAKIKPKFIVLSGNPNRAPHFNLIENKSIQKWFSPSDLKKIESDLSKIKSEIQKHPICPCCCIIFAALITLILVIGMAAGIIALQIFHTHETKKKVYQFEVIFFAVLGICVVVCSLVNQYCYAHRMRRREVHQMIKSWEILQSSIKFQLNFDIPVSLNKLKIYYRESSQGSLYNEVIPNNPGINLQDRRSSRIPKEELYLVNKPVILVNQPPFYSDVHEDGFTEFSIGDDEPHLTVKDVDRMIVPHMNPNTDTHR